MSTATDQTIEAAGGVRLAVLAAEARTRPGM